MFRRFLAHPAVAPGIRAVRSQLAPLLVLQVLAVALVVSYYRFPQVRDSTVLLAGVKAAGGIAFSFVAGALAGGAFPELAKAVLGRTRALDRKWAGSAAYNGLVYGLVGVQVDLFYRLQAVLFGDGVDWQTLVLKTFVDMGLFAPFLCIPSAALMYAWQRGGFRFSRELFSRRFYAREVWPALIPCWAFWIPMLFCVYSMPTSLQFCFAILAEAAWSMVFVFMATADRSES